MKLKIKSKKEITNEVDAEIIKSGKLPKSIELELDDYLKLAEKSIQREDGLYYKGIRLVVK
jgi:hypothetical protein